jgi:uncharacterized repeat protein (TIGR03833 family)
MVYLDVAVEKIFITRSGLPLHLFSLTWGGSQTTRLSEGWGHFGKKNPIYKVRINSKGVFMNGTNRHQIKPGTKVKVVQKQDQSTGKTTAGIVKDILTKSPSHPHGIKVRLENGIVGRVKEILDPESNQSRG